MGLSLLAESWTWYGFVLLVVAFRYTSRIWHAGSLKRLAAEDWIMLLVFAFYTVLVACMNIVAGVDTNLINPDDIPNLTPDSISARVYGSKMVLVVEQCMITTQWGNKICLLLLYNKLTFGLKQHYAVKIVAAYVMVTWVVMDICYFGVWCRPFHDYWQVPTDNIQCSAAIHHLIMNAVFNISSDIMMLCIPLPLLIHSKLPKLKKAALCVLFGMGVFVILCAALNKYYSFAQPFSPMWTFWYIREASVAVMIANIPNCWPLLRHICKFRSFNGTSYGQNTTTANLPSRTEMRSFARSRLASQNRDADPESNIKLSKASQAVLSMTESQTDLKHNDCESRSNNGSDISDHAHMVEVTEWPLEIWRKDEVTVNGEREEDGERARNIMYGGALDSDFRTKTVVTAQEMTKEHGHGR